MWRRKPSKRLRCASGIFLYFFIWLLCATTNLAISQENYDDEDPSDDEPLAIFIRFDGVGCQPLCSEKFDRTWEVLANTFPGAVAQKIDCETEPMFCTRHGSHIPPNGPAFAYIIPENQQWHWYEGPRMMYALLLWIETTMDEISASKQKVDDGLQTHRNFDRIYHGNMWVREASESSGSGSGSTHEVSMDYVAMLSKLIVDYDIQSIVDVGCGDFRVMSHVDMGNATYHGWDVSSIAIERARERQLQTNDSYQSTANTGRNIRFSVSGVDQQYEGADLVIIKDVLQHLPLNEGMGIVSQLHKFKYAIIVNDVANESMPNKDLDFETGLRMVPGGFRATNVEMPPFNLHCKEKSSLHSSLRSSVPGATKTTCFIILSHHGENSYSGMEEAIDVGAGGLDEEACTAGSTCFQATEEYEEAEKASVSKHREAYLQIAYWREYADLAQTYETTMEGGRLRYNIAARLKFLEQTLDIPKENSVLIGG